MSHTNNPQAAQMADESMLRTLAAQAQAIWPQERALIRAYGLEGKFRVLDVACGPGEMSLRWLEMFPDAELLGVDVDEAHLERARERCAHLGGRARFAVGDAMDLALDAPGFDVVVCRHLLQAVPSARAVLTQLVRAARPGGRVHVVAEDYAMMHFHPTHHDIDRFWHDGPIRYARAIGTDLLSGRKIFSELRALGVADARVDYVTVDTVRVDRQVFAAIWRAWRDGYAAAIAEHTELDEAYVTACFDDMIACIESPDGYAVWQLPVITGTR